MAVAQYPYIPLNPSPPRPPVLNLVTSSNRPDPSAFELNGTGRQTLPSGAPDGERAPSDEDQGDEYPAESIFAATPGNLLARMAGGFAYRPESQATAWTGDPRQSIAADPTYFDPPIVQYVPYLIKVEDSASTFGWSERNYKARALRLLDAATPNAIETEFWTGAQAQLSSWPNNYLMNHGTQKGAGGASVAFVDLTPSGTAPSVTRALAILEDYLANTNSEAIGNPAGIYSGIGAQGMVHCMPQTTPNLLATRRVGNLLLSSQDNIIVPGSGYTGLDPLVGTVTAGTSVMYATDIPMVILDEATVYPDTLAAAVDRAQNSISFRAERYAAAPFDSLRHAAVRCTLGV